MGKKKMRSSLIGLTVRSLVLVALSPWAMADVCFRQGAFVSPSSSGNYTVGNLTCQPKIVFFSYTRSPDNAILNGSNDNGFGFATSSSSQFTIYSVDASSSSANLIRHDNTSVIRSGLANDTSVVRASFVSINSDGFTINFSSTNTSYAQIIRWFVIGGSDLTGVSIVRYQYDGSSPQTLSGAGFAPDAAILVTAGLPDTPPATLMNTSYTYAIGFAAREQGAQGAFSTWSNYTSTVRTRAQTQSVTDPAYRRILYAAGETSIQASAYVSSWGSDGISLTWDIAPPAAWHFWVIYLKGPQFNMQVFNNPAATGSTQVLGSPFVPSAAFVGSFCTTPNTTVATSAYLSLGWAIDSSNQGFRYSGRNGSNTGSASAKYSTHVAGCYSVSIGGNATELVRGAFSQWVSGSGNNNGMEVSWTVTSTTQRQYIAFFIGQPAQPPPPPPSTRLGARLVQGLFDMSSALLELPRVAVAGLPAASGSANRVYMVTDGSGPGDCSSGGGSTRNLCVSTGTEWVALGDGGAGSGGSGDISAVGNCVVGDCFQSMTANTVFAAPNGSSGQASFRSLVAADIPNLDASKITTGTFADSLISQSSVTQHQAALQISGSQITSGTVSEARIDAAIARDSEINVQGTANEITSSGSGVSPVLSIANTFRITGKAATAPIKTGTTLPSTCFVGDYFFKTDAPAGQNTYACTSTNTWTLQGGGGGGSSTFLGLTDTPSSYSGHAGKTVAVNSGASALEFVSPGGDVSGTIGSMTVTRLQGRDVSSSAPSSGQVLRWNGASNQWEPATYSPQQTLSLAWHFPGVVTPGIQPARAVVPEGVSNCSITNARISVGTTASGASTWNIQRCTGGPGNCSSSSNIYNSAITLNANTESVAGGTPNSTTIAAGDAFRVNLVSVGSGLADVTVTMTYVCGT